MNLDFQSLDCVDSDAISTQDDPGRINKRLEEERKALGSDIKDIFAEAKSAGFDVKALRQIIRIRKQEPADVEEQETLLDVYRRALGM